MRVWVGILIFHLRADISVIDKDGCTPIHLAAHFRRSSGFIMALIDHMVDIKVKRAQMAAEERMKAIICGITQRLDEEACW